MLCAHELQIGQMTLRSKHLTALDSKIANLPDVALIFGHATMQASLLEKAEHRQRYNLVLVGGLSNSGNRWVKSTIWSTGQGRTELRLRCRIISGGCTIRPSSFPRSTGSQGSSSR